MPQNLTYMDQDGKICQNCQRRFIIEAADFKFYQKIQVPPPTFCPECRLQRRLAWRNERALYKRKCDAPGHNEEIISIYSADKPFRVYDQKYWWSDNWDPMDYGRDYDWNRPFFEQFRELIREVPVAALNDKNSVNSEYCNYCLDNKRCYLSVGSGRNENVFYSTYTWFSWDIFDNYNLIKGELCYENIDSEQNYKVLFSQFCNSITDSILLYDSKNCGNSIASLNLRNKNFFYFNKNINKENIRSIFESLGSYKNFTDLYTKFKEFKITQPHRYTKIIKSHNVSGDNIRESKNCYYAFEIVTFGSGGAEDCKFIFRAGANLKDCYDSSQTGFNVNLAYEGVSLLRSSNIKFSHFTWDGLNISYSSDCHSSSNLFGCVGLRHKQYCILNKQYTKESFDRLRTKIIEHMNAMPYISKIQKSNLKNQNDKFSAQGGSAPGGKITKSQPREIVYRYGEFFPPELSPFSYNETVAQEYFPLTREEAINKGYSWKEPEQRNYQISITNDKLPDHIKDVKDDILDQIIECGHQGKCNEQCTEAFKIIEPELAFYRKMNLPLPRLCPNCRHYQRIKQRNPLKLWHRKCMCAGKTSDKQPETGYKYQNTAGHPHHEENHCPNEFETSYSPERPEIVYCEQCYLAEVV